MEDCLALVHPEDRPEAARRNEACAREGADFEMDFRVVWPDGRVHWLSGKGKTFVDANGHPLYMTGAYVDITVQKQQEAEARQLAEFERQILGIVSHDLRNPLSAIIASASFLRDDESLGNRQLRAVQRIARSADRMARMIADLLDFTRGRLGGGIPLSRQPGNLRHICRHVVDELEASHPGRELRLTAEGHFLGEWDADRLAQVIGNLGKNALDYSPEGTPVDFRLHEEGAALCLEVHNQGGPIPADRISQLFEPFRRGAQDEGRTSPGLGLGLYIVQQIVQAHGGTIAVHSTAADGTTFTVRLPRTGEITDPQH
jgi:signal transduction histidine kinase